VLDPVNRMRPVREPVLGERAFRLTGIPYIKRVGKMDFVTLWRKYFLSPVITVRIV
jgi:hypothetical protein